MSYLTGPFDLEDIEREVRTDPRGFMAECDHALSGRILRTAAQIAAGVRARPIVLLAGPSGSGKTTTAGKLAQELRWIGVGAEVISMDDYFLTVGEDTHPLDARGNIDFESPECMDIPLLVEHFRRLVNGEEIHVPRFDFQNQRRDPDKVKPLRLRRDEVVIFEGIHALNPLLMGEGETASREVRVYASARANTRSGGEMVYKGTWMRLTRRIIRDDNFRGWPPDKTFRLWANVRRGEKKYISPYKEAADFKIDTALAYEIPALRDHALPLFVSVPGDVERAAELRQIHDQLVRFPSLPEAWVSKRSLLREFIGGGLL